MGKGALDDRSLLSLPAVGVQARDSMTAGLDEADVVVCVGYDLVEFGPAAWNGSQRKRIVHVDARPAEVDADYIPEVELVGDIGETLRLLRDELPARPVPAYATRLRVAVTTELRATVERPASSAPRPRSWRSAGAMAPCGHPHLGRRRPQALARPALPRLRAEHRHHQQRLRHDGHRPAGRDRGRPGPAASAAP